MSNKLQEWADTNGLNFSTAKTVCIHFCRLGKFHPDPQLLLNGSPIPVIEEVKFLDIIFPTFRRMSVVAKRLDGSRCHLVGGKPQPRRRCVRWGTQIPL